MVKSKTPDEKPADNDFKWGEGMATNGPTNDNASRAPSPDGFFGGAPPAASPPASLGSMPTGTKDVVDTLFGTGDGPAVNSEQSTMAVLGDWRAAGPSERPNDSAVTDDGEQAEAADSTPNAAEAPQLDISNPPAAIGSGGSTRPRAERPLAQTAIGLAPPTDMDALIDHEITKVSPSPLSKPPARRGDTAAPQGLGQPAATASHAASETADEMVTATGAPAPLADATAAAGAAAESASGRPSPKRSSPRASRAGLAPPREPRPEPLRLSDDEISITFEEVSSPPASAASAAADRSAHPSQAVASDRPDASQVPSSGHPGSSTPTSSPAPQAAGRDSAAAPKDQTVPTASPASQPSAAPASAPTGRRARNWTLAAVGLVAAGAVAFFVSGGGFDRLRGLSDGSGNLLNALPLSSPAPATPPGPAVPGVSAGPTAAPMADAQAPQGVGPSPKPGVIAKAAAEEAAANQASAKQGKAGGPPRQKAPGQPALTQVPAKAPAAAPPAAAPPTADLPPARPARTEVLGPNQAVRLARRARTAGDYAAADAALTATLEKHPKDHHVKEALAQVQLALGRAAEALPLVRAIVKKRPRRTSYRLLLGDVLWAVGQHQEAIDTWRGIARKHPDDSRAARRLRTHTAP